jgi:hypothetical protein
LKLGTLLLRDAVITLAQLEAALRAQVLYGGRLGTNLVELGVIDLDRLGVYLGRASGRPVASRERLEHADRDAIGAFPRDLAELHLAFPLGADPERPAALALAVVDADDQRALEQLATSLGRPITAHVAPELRIHYYLERHYGIMRKARFVRPGERPLQPVTDDRRRAQPAQGLELPPTVRFEPKRRKQTARPASEGARPPRLGLDEARARIEAAVARDHIADALIDFTIGRFDVAVAFVLRDANAIGWRVQTADRTAAVADIEGLSLPLGGASALQAAHDARAVFRGPPPSAGRPVERRLWDALRLVVEPEEILVVPVVVKARVVNLIYAHVAAGGALDERCVGELGQLARAAAQAYLRLIQAAKGAER